MRHELASELERAVERLVAQFHPQRIILFGSQARNTADARSDVDLLVIMHFEKRPGVRLQLMMEMIRSLRGMKIACDVAILTPEEFEIDRLIPGTIARPASREGRILYEAA